MKLVERIACLQSLFISLEVVTSRIVKQQLINTVPDVLKDDLKFCLEILDGRHKLGYTAYDTGGLWAGDCFDEVKSVKEYLQPLWLPVNTKDFRTETIRMALSMCPLYRSFYIPLVNRTYRLGIGRSIIPAAGMAPMLAKNLEDRFDKLPDGMYSLTEKLDGNRCIAWYDGDDWRYQSRNAKEMYVRFDMSSLPTDRVYDGEILSPAQTLQSVRIAEYILTGRVVTKMPANISFNQTSGLINTRTADKHLIYNIFDILDDDMTYVNRRKFLESIAKDLEAISSNVRILPLLGYVNRSNLFDKACLLLNKVTAMGGEGVMINNVNDIYKHNRVDSLLKFKKVKSMDMRVIDVIPGTGVPGPGRKGSLEVAMYTDDGDFVTSKVGSGISDLQADMWAENPGEIIGKIVEIEYFELSQDKTGLGTKTYSLRFPRLKEIRTDKSETSQH